MRLSGNTILVTGGTSGIGRALAEALFDCGNRVIVVGRRQELLDAVSADRPGITGIRLDLNDGGGVAHFAEEVVARFPDLNVLIANAGIAIEESLAEAWNWASTQAMIDTNIVGTLRMISALLPSLKLRPAAAIMATSSNLAFVPVAAFPTYCASKAFLHSLLESLRHQLRAFPIEVLELVPPYVQTELCGHEQATDPHAMPLRAYVDEVMALLAAGNHASGEVVVERAQDARRAERDGRYEAIFALLNPT